MGQFNQQWGWLAGLWLLAMPVNATAQPLPDINHKSFQLLAQAVEPEVPTAEAHRLFDQGAEYYRRSEFREALAAWEAALQLYRSLAQEAEFPEKNRLNQADTLTNLGEVYDDLGQHERAIELLNQALVIYRDRTVQQVLPNDSLRGEADALVGLGNVYNTLSQYDRAIALQQEALAIYRSAHIQTTFPDTAAAGEASALSNLALNYRSLGQYDRAIDTHNQALELYRTQGNQRGEVISLNNLSIVYNLLSQHERSIEFRERSLAIAREIGYRQAEAASLGGLANDYYELAEYDQAVEFYKQALVIFQDIGDRVGEGHIFHGLGIAYYYLGDYDQAIDYAQQGLAIYQETGYLASVSDLLIMLGIVHDALRDHDQAIGHYQQALALTRQIGYRASEADALNNLGLVYLQLDQPDTAEDVLTTAVDILDSLRASGLADAAQISLLQRQQHTFTSLQRALVAQEKYGAALEVAERGRTRAFMALMAQRADKSVVPSLDDNQPLELKEITALAQQLQTTLVEYSIVNISELSESLLYIWVVSPDGTINFRQSTLPDISLKDMVQDSRQAMGVRGRGFSTVFPNHISRTPQFSSAGDPVTELTELYDLLIEPIAELLPEDPEETVVFIPHGELFLLPFPALVNSDGEYLIKNHTVLTAPSIQVLAVTEEMANQRKENTFKNPLLVGNPVMPTVPMRSRTGRLIEESLPELPGAEQEVWDIAAFLDAAALVGEVATEAVVKQRLEDADLIHLATHGLLEYGDPEETGSEDTPGALALAPSLLEDGLLTTAEILQLDLQADLVVLSACDTGRGRITGDGVIGLSRAFVAAGAPSLVVSLWAVPDAPTAELMTEFYRQLSLGESKAQALRQAMLMTMEMHEHPVAWAAFTLVGAN
ncbi:MAG: CHAT domain-containing tetratricopeptide repeat protein [Cyanobacteria bacterium P01_D01_bin.56]